MLYDVLIPPLFVSLLELIKRGKAALWIPRSHKGRVSIALNLKDVVITVHAVVFLVQSELVDVILVFVQCAHVGVMEHVSAREVQLALDAGYDFVVVLETMERSAAELPTLTVYAMARALGGNGGETSGAIGVPWTVHGRNDAASDRAAFGRSLDRVEYVVFAEMDQLHWQRPSTSALLREARQTCSEIILPHRTSAVPVDVAAELYKSMDNSTRASLNRSREASVDVGGGGGGVLDRMVVSWGPFRVTTL